MFKVVITITPILLLQGWCFAQNWLAVGPGIGCGNADYLWDINRSEDDSLLLIAGAIWSDGNCDSARVFLTWDGHQFDAPGGYTVEVQGIIAFEYQSQLYSSGPMVGK